MTVSKEKTMLLKDWNSVRKLVRRGLKWLGHDIPIVRKEKENTEI